MTTLKAQLETLKTKNRPATGDAWGREVERILDGIIDVIGGLSADVLESRPVDGDEKTMTRPGGAAAREDAGVDSAVEQDPRDHSPRGESPYESPQAGEVLGVPGAGTPPPEGARLSEETWAEKMLRRPDVRAAYEAEKAKESLFQTEPGESPFSEQNLADQWGRVRELVAAEGIDLDELVKSVPAPKLNGTDATSLTEELAEVVGEILSTPEIAQPLDTPQETEPGDALEMLIRELESQDNLATSDPIYMVQEKRRIWGIDPDHNSDGFEWYSPELNDTVPDDEMGDRDRSDFTAAHYRDEWVNSQPFLTRKAASEFIERQRHNLKSHRIYVESGYHNREWRWLRDFLPAIQSERARNAKMVEDLEGRLTAIRQHCAKVSGVVNDGVPVVAPNVVYLADSILELAKGRKLTDDPSPPKSGSDRIAELESQLAEKERAPDASLDTISEELMHGGPWLGAAREWAKWCVPGGDTLEWGSSESVSIPFAKLWEMAERVAEAAIREERKARARETLDIKDRWALQQKVEQLESQLEEAGKQEEGFEKSLRQAQEDDDSHVAELDEFHMSVAAVLGMVDDGDSMPEPAEQSELLERLAALVEAEAERDTLRRERDEARTDAELKRQAANEFQRLLGDAESQLAEVTRRFEAQTSTVLAWIEANSNQPPRGFINFANLRERLKFPAEAPAIVWRDAPENPPAGWYWVRVYGDDNLCIVDAEQLRDMATGNTDDEGNCVLECAGPLHITEPTEPGEERDK